MLLAEVANRHYMMASNYEQNSYQQLSLFYNPVYHSNYTVPRFFTPIVPTAQKCELAKKKKKLFRRRLVSYTAFILQTIQFSQQ